MLEAGAPLLRLARSTNQPRPATTANRTAHNPRGAYTCCSNNKYPPLPVARRRRSLIALTVAGMATSGCLAVLSSAFAARAKPAFTGYFPASQYWGNDTVDLYYLDTSVQGDPTKLDNAKIDQKGATELLIGSEEENLKPSDITKTPSKDSVTKVDPAKSESLYGLESSPRLAFYADKEANEVIDKTKLNIETAKSKIYGFDLELTNQSKSNYLITFAWSMNPFNPSCNGEMGNSASESEDVSNAACSWSWDPDPESNDYEKPEKGTIIAFNYDGKLTPQSIWLASGSTVTFRTRMNRSESPELPPPDSQDVPAPLPALGAGAAFGMSRRLRSRLRRGETLNSATVPPVLAAQIPAPIAARQHRQLVASRYGALLGRPRPM